MIAIVNYGMGNLRSVQKAFDRLRIKAIITSDPSEINQADKIILPGVGHFRHGMDNLRKMDLLDILHTKVVEAKTPILGICLGMQLLTEFSEEGDCEGLGWIEAETKAFRIESSGIHLKIPHMGWNTIVTKKANFLLNEHNPEMPFYFVHSFHVQCHWDSCVAQTTYGISFSSVINEGHIFGTQFHPEKSHSQGLSILNRFAEYDNV